MFCLFVTRIFCGLQVFREIKVKDFDPSHFEQKQVFFPSKDGTKIPMFIIHKKVSAVPDGGGGAQG